MFRMFQDRLHMSQGLLSKGATYVDDGVNVTKWFKTDNKKLQILFLFQVINNLVINRICFKIQETDIQINLQAKETYNTYGIIKKYRKISNFIRITSLYIHQ